MRNNQQRVRARGTRPAHPASAPAPPPATGRAAAPPGARRRRARRRRPHLPRNRPLPSKTRAAACLCPAPRSASRDGRSVGRGGRCKLCTPPEGAAARGVAPPAAQHALRAPRSAPEGLESSFARAVSASAPAGRPRKRGAAPRSARRGPPGSAHFTTPRPSFGAPRWRTQPVRAAADALTVRARTLRNLCATACRHGRAAHRACVARPPGLASGRAGRKICQERARGRRAAWRVAHAFPPYQSPLQVLVGHLPRAPRALRRGLGRRAARERGGTRRGGAGERGVTSSRARVAPSGGPQARARSSRQGTVDRSKAGGASEKPPVGGRALRGW